MKKNSKAHFEFYYLAELTLQKIKLLSRWEAMLDKKSLIWLKRKGFHLDLIPRKTMLGKTVYETVFSTSSRYVDFYKRKFYNSQLKKTEASQRLEGFLFGYPSCCVNQFIMQPYSHNSLSKDRQKRLFYWACLNCRVTPELIPYYDSVYNETEEWFNYHFPDERINAVNKYRKKIITAAAAILFSAGLSYGQSENDTTHYIPLPDDLNLNGLTYAEEVYLGAYDYSKIRTSHQFALFYKSIIDSLPNTVQTNRTYREDYKMDGVVMCPKCGLYVNMGFVKIINPLRKLELDIPYLGLHFMEFGHFSYGDDDTFSRTNIDTLKKILFPFDPEHILPVIGDTDGDGLTDEEEDSLSTYYMINNSDSDNNGVPDGAQLAEELIRMFPKLKNTSDNIHSYIELLPVYGLENCNVCGSVHNMGYVEIINPENKRKLQIPFIALHALANGSFGYNGSVHQNERIDAVELTRAMKTHTIFIDDDSDNDGLNNTEELHFNLDTNNTDSNNNGITDAGELALKFVDSIKALPIEPKTDGPYIKYIEMKGIHICSICGEKVVMGIRKIYNPLINTTEPFEISNYAFHFLENGSFEHEGFPYLEGNNRIDPILLSIYLNISITGIDEDLTRTNPLQFTLYQNYPNPFNPVTKIKYSIPPGSPLLRGARGVLVTLKVYDVLGNEVECLINKEQPAGEYEVEFDGSNFTSGIYFYRLQADGFAAAKKFVLLK
jgi:transcription elongation factor Elf1